MIFQTDTDWAVDMKKALLNLWLCFVVSFLQVLAYFILGHWTLIFSYVVVIMIYEFIKTSIKNRNIKYDKHGMRIGE